MLMEDKSRAGAYKPKRIWILGLQESILSDAQGEEVYYVICWSKGHLILI
jgi:hypothetical protein